MGAPPRGRRSPSLAPLFCSVLAAAALAGCGEGASPQEPSGTGTGGIAGTGGITGTSSIRDRRRHGRR